MHRPELQPLDAAWQQRPVVEHAVQEEGDQPEEDGVGEEVGSWKGQPARGEPAQVCEGRDGRDRDGLEDEPADEETPHNGTSLARERRDVSPCFRPLFPPLVSALFPVLDLLAGHQGVGGLPMMSLVVL